MAHGYPDWGLFATKKTVYALHDNAELAARLGSIVTFDRRGDILRLDDFEDNIKKWEVSPSGTGASIALSSEAARNGGKSCAITTGDDIGDQSVLELSLSYTVLSKFGFEFSFTTNNNLEYIQLLFRITSGTHLHTYTVRYYLASDEVRIQNSDSAWVTIASNVDLLEYYYHFHTLKLVVDGENNQYVRLILNEVTYDLSDYAPTEAASDATPRLQITITAMNGTAANNTMYVDDAIVTHNEP